MRKFKTRPSLTFAFRLFLVVTGTLLLMAAFAPCANAQGIIRYYDFEGTAPPPPPPPGQDYGVNLESHTPAIETGAGTPALFLDNGVDPSVPYLALRTSVEAGIPMNVPPGAGANNTSLGFHRVGATGALGVQMAFPPSQFTGMYNVTSVSFAYQAQGNGYSNVALQISINGGAFTEIAGTSRPLPATGANGATINIAVPPGLTLNTNQFVLRLLFTGGTSNGTDLQFQIDNFQVGGTVPEPATVASGLLGVLGLCWFQRRRLIRAVRLRCTSG